MSKSSRKPEQPRNESDRLKSALKGLGPVDPAIIARIDQADARRAAIAAETLNNPSVETRLDDAARALALALFCLRVLESGNELLSVRPHEQRLALSQAADTVQDALSGLEAAQDLVPFAVSNLPAPAGVL